MDQVRKAVVTGASRGIGLALARRLAARGAEVWLVGAAATFAAFVPGMLARGTGRLVGISSLAADIPIGLSAAYSASKTGLTRYMESLDVELRPRGVSATVVHPGFVRTNALDGMGDLPMVVELDAAARKIEDALLRRARVVRFPWSLGVVFRAAAMLPPALRDPMIRRTTSRRT